MSHRIRVLISGRVQGVWFRESTRRCADELELAGWVRNRPDGRVEVCFDGEGAAVDEALAFVRRGPPSAQVTQVEVLDTNETDAPTPFEIRG